MFVFNGRPYHCKFFCTFLPQCYQSAPPNILRPVQSSGGPDALEETLGRLSKKAGVKATMVLDRASGAILKMSGQIASIRRSNGSSLSGPAAGSFPGDATNPPQQVGGGGESQGAEELAALVWNFVNSAGGLVQELDTEVGPLYKTVVRSSSFRRGN